MSGFICICLCGASGRGEKESVLNGANAGSVRAIYCIPFERCPPDFDEVDGAEGGRFWMDCDSGDEQQCPASIR
jgi:hypothetical protein